MVIVLFVDCFSVFFFKILSFLENRSSFLKNLDFEFYFVYVIYFNIYIYKLFVV